ncbi:hypothetical protein L2E82_51654 [Cichorium intybus]|nr:hypothetical protein L2E82_51654 [Cichorium intybus]
MPRSKSGLDNIPSINRSPVGGSAQLNITNIGNSSPVKENEPNTPNSAQDQSSVNRGLLDECLDTLKSLLSRKTPLKTKLELLDVGNRIEKRETKMEADQGSKKEKYQLSPRITRSQSRRWSSTNHPTNFDMLEESQSDAISTQSAVSSRVAEIGEMCGFKRNTRQGFDRNIGINVNKGGANKTQ